MSTETLAEAGNSQVKNYKAGKFCRPFFYHIIKCNLILLYK